MGQEIPDQIQRPSECLIERKPQKAAQTVWAERGLQGFLTQIVGVLMSGLSGSRRGSEDSDLG